MRGRVIALFVYFAATAAAQRLAYLYGRILDDSQAGIGQAAITATNEDSGFRRTAESDPAGAYSISSLEPGIYKIMVHREGFRDVIQFDVRLAAAASTRADFTLRIGRLGETITVEGFTPLIEQDSAATGGRFDSDEIQRLPLNGRGLLTLLELIPGTNVTPATRGEPGQFTTTGQRPNTNYFTIDGITGNLGVTAGGVPAQFSGGAMPALSAFGSLDSLISLEAVEEFRVQTSTEVAEFGRLPGASVSLTSRSGSNQLHGATSYRVRNEFLGANDWFGNQAGYGRLPLRMQDVTQSVGGPLWRNHTFFFLDYERSALTQPYVWVQPVPTVQLRGSAPAWAQPALNLFPLPNDVNQTGTVANWAGRVTRPAGLQTGAARLDQTLSRRVNLFLRYNDSPSYSEFGSIQINQLDFRFQSLTLGVTAHPTANLTLDSRLNGSKAGAHSVWSEQPGPPGCELVSLVISFGNAPNPCAYLTRFQISGIAQLEAGREGDRRQGQFQVIETGAWRHGGHSITLGADYRDILAVRRDAGPTLSVIAEDLATLADRNSFLTSTAPRQWLSANVRELSLWAQDTWQARPWLTVSAGLRWEYSPAPLSDPTTNFLDPASGTLVTPVQPQPLWRDSTRYFAPRLGVALRLNKSGRTVLRAGGGLYYDSSLSIATDLLNNGPLSVSEYRGSLGIFPVALTFGLLPDLSLPEVRQWNVSLEQAIGSHDMVSLGYVGSEGRFLIRRELGGPANTSTDRVALTTNHGASSYDALQIEYRHRVARGLQAVASYAWSHALDNDSSDAFLVWAGAGTSPTLDHASSDFDLRHSLTASLSYEFPPPADGPALRRFFHGWGIDGVFHARTGFPITVLDSDEYLGVTLIDAFRPHLLPGLPVWINDPNSPGGRRLNPSAFLPDLPGVQGTMGRNMISGFGMTQLDLALRREFDLGEQRRFQIRLEGFNALNHPNFADPVKYLNSPVFGQSTSMLNLMLGTGSPGSGLAPFLQTGGARTLQVSLRFQF